MLLGRKTMTNLDSILKSKGIILLIKVYVVKVMVFLPRSKSFKFMAAVTVCGDFWTPRK